MVRAAIDTGALLALANGTDQYHGRAVSSARKFLARGGRWTGTVLVLAELHGHLLRLRGPESARELVDSIRRDRAYLWRDVDADLVEAAINDWLKRFGDQRFSLTDAVTFEMMRRERINTAFAFDRHFLVAGYKLLDTLDE
jgi:hypothetical protein